MRRGPGPAAGSVATLAAALLFFGLGVARAETAWVGGEVRLNLRAGPGLQYRILRELKTGDSVNVLERGEGWTKVATRGGQEGWIPAGYLASQPPPQVKLDHLEAEVAELRSKLAALEAEAERLRKENEELRGRDQGQQEQIRELTAENLDLKAGERWPYLIAGASILVSGMLMGALLHASSTRRRQPRIRF